MKKLIVLTLIAFLVISLTLVSSLEGFNVDVYGSSVSNGGQSGINAPEATATFSAGQFYLQLTAMAQPGP